MPGPLDGIRILDFSRFQQGPAATVMLSDLGADVIKVEPPGGGDLGRSLGREPDGWCSYYEAHNRNKRSMTLDLKEPRGREILHKLVPNIDVVVDNFRPGVPARLGIDLESLRPYNPAIITASGTGYGERGPIAQEPSFDINGMAMGGIMYSQGGGPDQPPQTVQLGFADQVGAMSLALAIVSAIVARDRQGVGQHVESSLLGAQIGLQTWYITDFLRRGEQGPTPQRRMPIFNYYRAADDRYLTIAILDPRWFRPLCEALGRPDLADDPRFVDPFARQDARDVLLAELDAAFATRPRDEWLRLLRDAGIPVAPVHDYAALTEDPQVLANEYITTLEHPSLGTIDVTGTPIKMSETPTGPRAAAPELGLHTEEILLGLGYDWDAIAVLKDDGVI